MGEKLIKLTFYRYRADYHSEKLKAARLSKDKDKIEHHYAATYKAQRMIAWLNQQPS